MNLSPKQYQKIFGKQYLNTLDDLKNSQSMKTLMKAFHYRPSSAKINIDLFESQEYRENIYYLSRLLSKNAKRILGFLLRLTSIKIIYTLVMLLTKYSKTAGKLSILYRLPQTLAYSQKQFLLKDKEKYTVIAKSKKFERHLKKHSEKKLKNFYHLFGYHKDDALGQNISDATSGDLPEYFCIGSGPGVVSTIKGILSKKPQATFWVVDMGDYFSQEQFFSLTPMQSVLRSYVGGGFSPIFNGATDMTVSVAPSVFGGGAEIFSGTAIKNSPWYIKKMGLQHSYYDDLYKKISHECNVGLQKMNLVSQGQKRFWQGALKENYRPFLLGKFGYQFDEGRGRDYAGFKGRIPYLEQFLSDPKINIRGIANCRVAKLKINNQKITGITLEFLGKIDRQVLAIKELNFSKYTKVLLGAGSLGNFKLLKRSGIAKLQGYGITHQYTAEILGLFEDELPANGNPQAIGVVLKPESSDSENPQRQIIIEGAHPGRAILSTIGTGPVQNVPALRSLQKNIGCMGVLITEEKKGKHKLIGSTPITTQKYTKVDKNKIYWGVEQAMKIWQQSGAKAVGVNSPVFYKSKNKLMRDTGFIEVNEIDKAMRHIRKSGVQTQTFYRTGNFHGLLDQKTGQHPQLYNGFIVSEDSIPPGPGINPTYGLMIQARHSGENIARIK